MASPGWTSGSWVRPRTIPAQGALSTLRSRPKGLLWIEIACPRRSGAPRSTLRSRIPPLRERIQRVRSIHSRSGGEAGSPGIILRWRSTLSTPWIPTSMNGRSKPRALPAS